MLSWTRKTQAFWRTPPTAPSADAYQYGIAAVSRRDGRAMIRAGWTLWRSDGLHERQSRDLLLDGYTIWRDSDDFDPDEALSFLIDLFETLLMQRPPYCPANIWAAPQGDVMPAASYHATRAWAATQLLIDASRLGCTDLFERYERTAFDTLAATPPDFLPPRSIEVGRQLATRLGVSAPWPR